MCLRIGKLSITEGISGVFRADSVESLQDLLQGKASDPNSTDQFSALVVAWFKPHSALPLAQLFSVGGNPVEDLVFSETQRQALVEQYAVAMHLVCSVVLQHDQYGGDLLTYPLHLGCSMLPSSACLYFKARNFSG